MDVKVLGIGLAQPQTIAQDQAAALAAQRCCQNPRQSRLLASVYRHSQVDQRASVLLREPASAESFYPPPSDADDRGPGTQQRMRRYQHEAPALALAAAQAALADANVIADRITHLVTVSCTGFAAPGFDIALMQSLGLPSSVARTHVGFMGCHGALNGLRVAKAFCADPQARVLLCAVELCSLHFHYGWDSEKVVANALFADGAAAAVLGNGQSHDDRGTWRVVDHAAQLFPDSLAAMTWRIGDHGFEMTLSPQVPALVEQHLGPWLGAWLGEHGLSARQVGSWAIHPGGPRILDAVQSALNLDAAATAMSRRVLAQCGNMSSPTVLFILEALRRAAAPTPCVAIGLGPGLCAEAALLRETDAAQGWRGGRRVSATQNKA